MTEEEARSEVVTRYLEKADKAIAAAHRELAAEDLELSVNRAYYACFYALTAVLVRDGRTFSKHSGVRAALHQHLIRPGTVAPEYGRSYDHLFDARQEADYGTVSRLDDPAVAANILGEAERFVAEMRRVLAQT
jgi:uncharacterized protein